MQFAEAAELVVDVVLDEVAREVVVFVAVVVVTIVDVTDVTDVDAVDNGAVGVVWVALGY